MPASSRPDASATIGVFDFFDVLKFFRLAHGHKSLFFYTLDGSKNDIDVGKHLFIPDVSKMIILGVMKLIFLK